jgi:hypothetical protein
MSVKQLFKGIVEYPSPDKFSDVPKNYQFQPDNKTRYGRGRVLTLEEAFSDIEVVRPDESGCAIAQ